VQAIAFAWRHAYVSITLRWTILPNAPPKIGPIGPRRED
jgi:hypothetical protein